MILKDVDEYLGIPNEEPKDNTFSSVKKASKIYNLANAFAAKGKDLWPILRTAMTADWCGHDDDLVMIAMSLYNIIYSDESIVVKALVKLINENGVGAICSFGKALENAILTKEMEEKLHY